MKEHPVVVCLCDDRSSAAKRRLASSSASEEELCGSDVEARQPEPSRHRRNSTVHRRLLPASNTGTGHHGKLRAVSSASESDGDVPQETRGSSGGDSASTGDMSSSLVAVSDLEDDDDGEGADAAVRFVTCMLCPSTCP
jgi:hypothetical protein